MVIGMIIEKNRGVGVWEKLGILRYPHVKIPNINVEKYKRGTLN